LLFLHTSVPILSMLASSLPNSFHSVKQT
jgi:hypothetical protein